MIEDGDNKLNHRLEDHTFCVNSWCDCDIELKGLMQWMARHIRSLESRIQDLLGNIGDAALTVQQLEARCKELEHENKMYVGANNILHEKVEEQRNELEERVKELEAMLQKQSEKIAAYEQRHDVVMEQLNLKESAAEDLQQQVRELEEVIDSAAKDAQEHWRDDD